MTRYWCHICNSFVHVHGDPLLCVTCDGEFVEVVAEEEPVQPQAAPIPPPNGPQMMDGNVFNAQGGSLFDVLGGLFGNLNANARQQPAAPGPQAQAGMQPLFALQQQLNELRQRLEQQAQQQPNQAGPGFVQYNIPFNQLFGFGMQPGNMQDMFAGFGGPQQFGDYASDAGMQAILDRLFRQHQAAQVPASKTIFDKLPTKKFTKDDATGECAICKCDWAENDEGVELPCHHVFHADCVGQWFKSSNQCPMCRFEVETDDPEYEKVRKDKIAEQEANNIMRTSSSNVTPPAPTTAPTATSSASTASTASSTSNSSATPPSSRLTPEEQDALLDEVISLSSDDSSSMDLSTEYDSAQGESQPISISSASPEGTPQETRRATKRKKERDPDLEVD